MNRVLDEIKSLLSTAMTTRIKSYYKGEVEPVPQSYLPALMIWGKSTTVVALSTAKDQYVYEIGIKVIIDLKTQLDEAGTGEIIKSQQEIINIMEERNTDGTLKSDTVLGTLRDTDNVKGTDYLFNNEIKIEYEKIEGDEFPYIRAELTLEATTNLLTRP